MQNVQDGRTKIQDVLQQVSRVILGKDEVLCKIMMAILCQGHILIDDIPGVGKTTMALAFSKAMGLTEGRIQFTPDVLPSDITGFSVINRNDNSFQYKTGAIMCNLFLADEINRTSPKTQSALLQVMEEGKVTVDGITREVPRPFVVIATQNPTGSIGTQKLPESQLDRFMIRTTIGYPELMDEINILKGRQFDLINEIKPVITGSELIRLQEIVQGIHVDNAIYMYIAQLIQKTRGVKEFHLGVSPRGSIALLSMAKAMAFLRGNGYVTPADVQEVYFDVSAHRVILNANAKIKNISEKDILNHILREVPVPKII